MHRKRKGILRDKFICRRVCLFAFCAGILRRIDSEARCFRARRKAHRVLPACGLAKPGHYVFEPDLFEFERAVDDSESPPQHSLTFLFLYFMSKIPPFFFFLVFFCLIFHGNEKSCLFTAESVNEKSITALSFRQILQRGFFIISP